MKMNPKKHPILNFFDELEKSEKCHMSPEESLIQCLLYDYQHHGLCTDYLRFIDWENSVNWHPNTLIDSHYDAIKNTNALFARKFSEESSDLLDRIDREIIGI
jgi:hypothetical protein